jgi:hypothetical protein
MPPRAAKGITTYDPSKADRGKIGSSMQPRKPGVLLAGLVVSDPTSYNTESLRLSGYQRLWTLPGQAMCLILYLGRHVEWSCEIIDVEFSV